MLIARAPMRISFGGGGTDLAAYYSQFGGLVVSAAINKYSYAVLSEDSSGDVQVISADYASFRRQPIVEDLVWDGDLALPLAVVDHFGLRKGLSVFLASEVPPGTGLGSSSALAVALIRALARYRRQHLSPKQVAELAAYIEIDKMGMPIGKQDQYASAYGGLNVIRFAARGVTVEPLPLSEGSHQELQDSLMLFYTGSSRRSSTILSHQRKATQERAPVVLEALHALKGTAEEMIEALVKGDLTSFGRLLDRSWERKKLLDPRITNRFIDGCYRAARKAGALGGKITGAGGGGFLLLHCPPEQQMAVTKALEARGLRRMSFSFDLEGGQVLLESPFDRVAELQSLRADAA